MEVTENHWLSPHISLLAGDTSQLLKPAWLDLGVLALLALCKEPKAKKGQGTALVCFEAAMQKEINLLHRLRQLVLWVYKCSN